MASYAKTQTSLQAPVSVLAQAKPAIISSSTGTYDKHTTSALSEELDMTLRINSPVGQLNNNYQDKHQDLQKVKSFIEDDVVLQKQNASNQMRQNAVMAAVASQQQKVRLSATERLAMSAKRPIATQNPYQTHASMHHQRQISNSSINGSTNQQQTASSKLSPSAMPTLETLLAVQRQLQQHTRQNLNSTPQNMVKQQKQIDSAKPPVTSTPDTNVTTNGQQKPLLPPKLSTATAATTSSTTTNGLPPPPEVLEIQNNINQQIIMETYDKDLPPLPPSISPSTNSSDDSQMNSLESQQSSLPATSLVSTLPQPPPPPTSSYMEQYDEVTANQIHSNSSTPSTIASSEVSSIRHFPTVPIKMHLHQTPNTSITNQKSPSLSDHQVRNFDLPVPFKNQSPPALAPKPNFALNGKKNAPVTEQTNCYHPSQPSQSKTQQESHKLVLASRPQQITSNLQNSHPTSTNDINTHQNLQNQKAFSHTYTTSSFASLTSTSTTITQQTPRSYLTMSSSLMPPPPPPPPPMASAATIQDRPSGGFDEPDCETFRFPTPPPFDLLLDDDDEVLKKDIVAQLVNESNDNNNNNNNNNNSQDSDDDDDDDEDFQCRIPTPPMHKSISSMSSATFQPNSSHHLHMQIQQQQQLHQQSPQLFNSSTFTAPPISHPVQTSSQNASVPVSSALQPPPLFGQPQQKEQQQLARQSRPLVQHTNALQQPTPQLTVHINETNSTGLLSTATSEVAPSLPQQSVGAESGGLVNCSSSSSNNNNSQSVNHHHHHHHHHHMMMTMAASSSSPSSSSDGDGHSSNSSSSTSGIHSSIDSPSSSESKLDDFNYAMSKVSNSLKSNMNGGKTKLQTSHSFTASSSLSSSANSNAISAQERFKKITSALNMHSNGGSIGSVTMTNGTQQKQPQCKQQQQYPPTNTTVCKPRPALKQKKSVSFSDKVELVACADEQTECHLPNPLLARVLAGKLQ